MRRPTLALLLLGSLVLAGCAQPGDRLTQDPVGTDPATTTTTSAAQCVAGHWHVTAAIHVPAERDGTGPDTPRRVDFAAPRAEDGTPYYDFANAARFGGPNGQTLALHMHMDAANPETGAHNVAVAQWHMEQDGACVPVGAALGHLDVGASATSLDFTGGHAQVPEQAGRFDASASRPLRWFVQAPEHPWDPADMDSAAQPWVWTEVTWDDVHRRQLGDGDSLLVALGNYTAAQVEQMKEDIPIPISRPRVMR